VTLACPVCGGMDVALYWSEVWNGSGKRVMRCTGCDLFFLDPPGTPEQQRSFDQSYSNYIAQRSSLVSRHTAAPFEAMVDESIEARLHDLDSLFDGVKSLLEVGAEQGGFLDRIRNRVAMICAIDACPEYAETLALKGYESYLYIWDVPEGNMFDRICFFSLLEHIHEPRPFLQMLRDLLAPGGRMIIEVPSAAEPLISLYDVPEFKSFYFQAMHPYVYSEKALEILLRDCGLIIEEMRCKQRYGLANHLRWLKDGVPGGSGVFADMFAGNANKAYIHALENHRHTDTLYIVARSA
jgi:SAM-dependent methyltransferase